jgi:hypothetical protein
MNLATRIAANIKDPKELKKLALIQTIFGKIKRITLRVAIFKQEGI